MKVMWITGVISVCVSAHTIIVVNSLCVCLFFHSGFSELELVKWVCMRSIKYSICMSTCGYVAEFPNVPVAQAYVTLSTARIHVPGYDTPCDLYNRKSTIVSQQWLCSIQLDQFSSVCSWELDFNHTPPRPLGVTHIISAAKHEMKKEMKKTGMRGVWVSAD